MWIVDFGFSQTEGAWQTLFGENHPRKIRLLQKFHETSRECCVVSDNIKKKKTPPPVSKQYDVSGFRLIIEFSLRIETGTAQDLPQIDRASDRRESVIGYDKNVCRVAHPLTLQHRK